MSTKDLPTRFENLLDLARLPYFEARAGRLVLADRSLGPAIDMHTHLALSYGPVRRTDLGRATDEALLYLPKQRAIDLDLYMNKNLSRRDLRDLKVDLALYAFTARGMRATHTVPNLAREMEELGVTRSVLLAIDFPFWSSNTRDWIAATRGRRDFVTFGSVHPLDPDPARALDEQVRLGARGIKFHPQVQQVPPDHPRAIALFRMCGERGLPMLHHCGPVGIEPESGRLRTQVYRYEKGIAECPGTQFALGHSGALQLGRAIDLARRYPNVWLELASQSLPGVRRILAEAPNDRVVYGSDWPFYHQAIGLAKVFLATDGNDALRRAVLHANAARLLGSLSESGPGE